MNLGKERGWTQIMGDGEVAGAEVDAGATEETHVDGLGNSFTQCA